jgi:rubrerythrin
VLYRPGPEDEKKCFEFGKLFAEKTIEVFNWGRRMQISTRRTWKNNHDQRTSWRCTVCGYVYDMQKKDRFENFR